MNTINESLSNTFTYLNPALLASALTPEAAGFYHIKLFTSTDSTNTQLKLEAAAGEPEGRVLIAEKQTAGKGRRGRSFYSPQGSGIYMSILHRPDLSLEDSLYLTTMTCVASAEAISEVFGLSCQIKWVNDLYFQGRKICGILTEASLDTDRPGRLCWAVTGIGLNLSEPEGGFPEPIQSSAGTLGLTFQQIKEKTSTYAGVFLSKLYEYYIRLPRRDYLDIYRRRSMLTGKKVRLIPGAPDEYFDVVGIDDSCHLLIRLPDGTIRVLSDGEVSVRTEGQSFVEMKEV